MKKLISLLVIVSQSVVANAQYFNQTSGWANADNAYQILDESGNIIVQGTYLQLINQYWASGLFIRKLDYSGNEIWSKSMIIDSVGMSTQIGGNFRKLSTGGYVASGVYKRAGEPLEMMVVKWDEFGDTMSLKRYPYAVECMGTSLQVLDNDDLIVFGDCRTIPGSTASIDKTIWKINAQGNLLWAQHYPSPNEDFTLSDSVDDAGNIYISGGNHSSPVGRITKVDSAGNHIWTKSYSFLGMNHSYYNGFLWASTSVKVGSGDFHYKVILMKLDTAGNVILTQQYDSLPYASTYVPPYRVDDKVFLAGTQYPSGSPFKGWLCLLDTLGQVQFSRSYDSSPAGEHRITAMTPTSDGGFAMAGYAVLPGQGQDHWVLKVDSLGCLVPNCALSEEELPATTAIQVWPNPTSGTLHLRLPENSSPAELSLTDITGRVVHHERVSANRYEHLLNISQLPPGMYFLHVRRADGSLVTEKIVKQ